LIVSESLFRLGNNKPTPKEYFFSIAKDGRLFYQAGKKKKTVKGWI
jgi:hypothetical protein